MAAVFFWLLKDVFAVVIVWAGIGLFALIGWLITGLKDSGASIGATIGLFVGWFVALIWLGFALVQVILQIIVAVQTVAG